MFVLKWRSEGTEWRNPLHYHHFLLYLQGIFIPVSLFSLSQSLQPHLVQLQYWVGCDLPMYDNSFFSSLLMPHISSICSSWTSKGLHYLLDSMGFCQWELSEDILGKGPRQLGYVFYMLTPFMLGYQGLRHSSKSTPMLWVALFLWICLELIIVIFLVFLQI